MTADVARRAAELLEGVTEGPYREYPDDPNGQAVIGGAHTEIATFWHHCVGSIEKEMRANAAFVLWAFENVPALLAERAALVEAVMGVIEASRAYLPPDGISADEFINRVLQATDNPRINSVIMETRDVPAH